MVKLARGRILAKLTCFSLILAVQIAAVCAAAPSTMADQASPQPSSPQAASPQGAAAESIPAGTPQAQTPAPQAGQTALDDNASWYAGTFGENCSTPGCCEICGGGSGPPPCYYIEGDVRVLMRSRAISGNLTYERTTGTEFQPTALELAPRLSFRSVDSIIAPGLEGTIGWFLGHDCNNRDEFLEFTYWGLENWQGTAGYQSGSYVFVENNSAGVPTLVTSSQNLYSPFPLTVLGFNRADFQKVTVDSTLNNFEVNYRFSARSAPDRMVLYPNGRWRRECRPGFYASYLVGLRLMQFDDVADYHSQGTTTNSAGATVPVTGDYDVTTHNTLLGAQIGGEYTYRQCCWQADVHGRAGTFFNVSEMHSSVVTTPNEPSPIDELTPIGLNSQVGINRDVAAVVGEFGFATTYKFRPNLIGRASYDFTWLGGLALAPDQFQFTANPQAAISAHGMMFVTGLSLGLEYTW